MKTTKFVLNLVFVISGGIQPRQSQNCLNSVYLENPADEIKRLCLISCDDIRFVNLNEINHFEDEIRINRTRPLVCFPANIFSKDAANL